MQVVDNLNLNDFFKNKGFIIIHFNQDSFEDQVTSLRFEDFKGKWLFCNYHDSWESKNEEDCVTFKSEIIYPNHLEFHGSKFDLNAYYEKIIKLYERYCEKYPNMPFPDIVILDTCIVNSHGSHLMFKKETKKHIIYISYNDLECIDVFSFTLGHELGHVVYMTNERENGQNLIDKRFTVLFPWEIAITWLFVMGISIVSYSNESYTIPQFLILSIMKIYVTLCFILSVLSFPRFLHYQNEFHSDRFSLELDPSINIENISGIFCSNFNSYTHPSSKLRLKEIRSFGNSKYKNPIMKHLWSLRLANGFEMRITFELFMRDITRCLQKYLSKIKKE